MQKLDQKTVQELAMMKVVCISLCISSSQIIYNTGSDVDFKAVVEDTEAEDSDGTNSDAEAESTKKGT